VGSSDRLAFRLNGPDDRLGELGKAGSSAHGNGERRVEEQAHISNVQAPSNG
jgi:hypothetical protein